MCILKNPNVEIVPEKEEHWCECETDNPAKLDNPNFVCCHPGIKVIAEYLCEDLLGYYPSVVFCVNCIKHTNPRTCKVTKL